MSIQRLLSIPFILCAVIWGAIDDGLVFRLIVPTNAGESLRDGIGKRPIVPDGGALILREGGVRAHTGTRFVVENSQDLLSGPAVTMAAWVALAKPDGYQAILFKGDRSAKPEQVELQWGFQHGIQEFKYKNAEGVWNGLMVRGDTAYSTSGIEVRKIPARRWVHVAAVFEGGKLSLFQDGSLVGTLSGLAFLTPGKQLLALAAAQQGGTRARAFTLDGLLGEVRLWSRVLSHDEIAAVFLEGRAGHGVNELAFVAGETIPDYDPDFKKKLSLTAAYEARLPQGLSTAPVSTKVGPWQGAPALFIDGKPTLGMQMMPSPFTGGPFHSCRDFAAAGMDLYSDIVYTDKDERFPGCRLGWNGEGSYDFSGIDARMNEILRANPRARILFRIKNDMPKWWLQKYPDEHSFVRVDGVLKDSGFHSMASEIWKRDYERMLRDVVRHVEQSPYGHRIFGYHPAGGYSSEWFWYGHDKGWLDYGPAATKSYQRWLEARYVKPTRLAEVWKTNIASFGEIAPPTTALRTASELLTLRDPAVATPVFDYREYLSEKTAEHIVNVCRICKEESGGRKIAGVFYGYAMCLSGWDENRLANIGFQALGKVLESSHVDFICAPTDYRERRGGEAGSFLSACLASFRSRNKLYWDEADIRTHLFDKNEFGRTDSLDETLSVFDRAFGYAMTRGTTLWWFLITGNAHFHQEALMQRIALYSRLGEQNLGVDKSPSAQAVFLFDEKSLTDFTARTGYRQALIWGAHQASVGCGAPFEVRLVEDVLRDDFPAYKLVVIPASTRVDERTRKALQAKLARSVTVWGYAPGLVSGNGFHEEGMKRLCGLDLKLSMDIEKLDPKVERASHPIVRGLVDSAAFRAGELRMEIQPAVFAQDASATTLLSSGGRAVMVVKEEKGARTVWSLVPLSRDLLTGLCDYSGVHVYQRAGDVLYANKRFLMLHTRTPGEKHLMLPEKARVTDLLSGKVLGSDLAEIREYLPAKSTRLWRLDP